VKRLKLILVLLLAAALLAGCTASFTYNRLDWLIPWYVDGYVDLSREQRQLLRQQLKPPLQWHREEELARYAALLDRIEADLAEASDAAGNPDPEMVRSWVDEILEAARRVERSMMSVALDFGETISESQMQEFIDSLWEQQREYEDEYLERSDAEYADDTFENLSDFLARFMGRLSTSQQAALRQAAERLQRFDAPWLEERRKWLETLEPMLQRQPGWREAVMEAHAGRLENRTPEYRAVLEHNLGLITAAVAEVIGGMTERQHGKASEELDDLRNKLHKLMDRPFEQAALQPASSQGSLLSSVGPNLPGKTDTPHQIMHLRPVADGVENGRVAEEGHAA
jgi:hypothetical protein